MKNTPKKNHKKSERGQAIILIAFAIIGMVAIVGLMTDGGIMLIEYARLKRGIDSASIAAASQFRKGFVGTDLKRAGEEFLKMNQSDAVVTVFTCDYPLGMTASQKLNWKLDASLCPAPGQPKRKLVRITATRHVDFGFMRVVGINGTEITATAIGEAASVDLVLAIDTSTSMAYETNGGVSLDAADATFPAAGTSPGDDPEICNAHMYDGPHATDPDLLKRCEPMGKVKDAAIDFVNQLFFPYDRVALVVSTGQTAGGAIRDPVTLLDFNDNFDPGTGAITTEIQTAIQNIRVFQPSRCPNPMSDNLNVKTPCLQFDDPANPNRYISQVCIPRLIGSLDPSDTTAPFNTKYYIGGVLIKDPTTCGPSNIGGMLYEAGKLYGAGAGYLGGRQDAFWGVIALYGGPANGSNPSGYPDGLCPQSTWSLSGGSGFCRDEDTMPGSYNPPVPSAWDVAGGQDAAYAEAFNWSSYIMNDANTKRHHFTVNTTDPLHPFNVYPAEYNADDYARDGADFIAAPSNKGGQGATLYSICMGNYCRAYPNVHDPASGELLGRYMAYNAGDQYDLLGNVTQAANHGSYFYAQQASDLQGPTGIFAKIAENIFTRISQ